MGAAADRGATTVGDRAVRRIAERAATEADVPVGDRPRAEVTRRGRSARLDLDVGLGYAADLPGAGDRVRRHVTDRTAELTGLDVPGTRVTITRLAAPEPVTPAPAAPVTPPADESARARRPWSDRRLSAGLVALSAAAVCGAFLTDFAFVRTGRSAAAWRVGTLDRISAVRLVDPWVWGVGAAIAVLGLWLVALALTPGARRRLPLTVPGPGTAATLDRAALGLLLRDAVLAVPGVSAVRLRMSRRKVRLRATAAFGDLPSVRDAVDRAVDEVLRGCGLVRPPRVRVRVVPEPDARAWIG
ncbi:DUF6286 domain-containing Asp23/Gls24 family envelope stress response protein [Streptomyces sp. NPDC058001]|uniref:DUF6286 domain-containing Asp23/Gls24 family envelope stress response protein n=1 Tax=Streptomyces sp. NPDC058001 TaxID=3346300 RepID=UPI0036E578C3